MIIEFIVWVSLCILVGYFAGKKGRSEIGFFLISFFLSPLVGLFIAIIASENRAVSEPIRMRKEGLKKCPKCGELIKREAITCRFCGNENFPIKQPKDTTPPTTPTKCEKCGHPLSPGNTLCGKCSHITETPKDGALEL